MLDLQVTFGSDVMELGTRRLIFFTLITAFVGYSLLIYFQGAGKNSELVQLPHGAREGKLLFQKYNCIACHQLYGLGGYMGPDLTNVISFPGKGPDYAAVFLRHGTNRMPDFKMSEQEVGELLAFLTYVDGTGISPPYNARINPDGSLTLPGEE